jgi:hypothetical protein
MQKGTVTFNGLASLSHGRSQAASTSANWAVHILHIEIGFALAYFAYYLHFVSSLHILHIGTKIL